MPELVIFDPMELAAKGATFDLERQKRPDVCATRSQRMVSPA